MIGPFVRLQAIGASLERLQALVVSMHRDLEEIEEAMGEMLRGPLDPSPSLSRSTTSTYLRAMARDHIRSRFAPDHSLRKGEPDSAIPDERRTVELLK